MSLTIKTQHNLGENEVIGQSSDPWEDETKGHICVYILLTLLKKFIAWSYSIAKLLVVLELSVSFL
jgi:hypothetical protein